MEPSMVNTLVAGGFALAGIVTGAGLTWLHSHFEYKRKKEDEQDEKLNREQAVFHGAFAVCNFLAERLNEWDNSRNVYSLARAAVAVPYLARLIENSPQESERLMVSLVDLGLRLDALLFSAGFSIAGGPALPEEADSNEVVAAVEELAGAVEIVQILLDGQLPMMSEEGLPQFPTLDEAEEKE